MQFGKVQLESRVGFREELEFLILQSATNDDVRIIGSLRHSCFDTYAWPPLAADDQLSHGLSDHFLCGGKMV
jgi:hypothetical protein